MHDLWRSFRGRTTGGGVVAARMNVSLWSQPGRLCDGKRRRAREKMKSHLTIVALRWCRASVARRARAVNVNHSHLSVWNGPIARKQRAARRCREPRAGIWAICRAARPNRLLRARLFRQPVPRNVGACPEQRRGDATSAKIPKMLRFVAFCCITLHGGNDFGWRAETTAGLGEAVRRRLQDQSKHRVSIHQVTSQLA